MTRLLRVLALVAMLALPVTGTAPLAAAAACPGEVTYRSSYVAPYNPLINSDFEVGMESLDEVRDPVPNGVLTAVGGLLPGFTENRSEVTAPGWTFRPYSGDNFPASTLTWGARLGDGSRADPQTRDGAVLVRYHRDDAGAGVPILTQAVGQRPSVGLVSAPREVGVWLASPTPDKPVAVRVGVYLVGDPEPVFSPKVWRPGNGTGFAFEVFPFAPVDSAVAQVFLAFVPLSEASHGGAVVVDDVTFGSVTMRPTVHPCPFPSGFPWALAP